MVLTQHHECVRSCSIHKLFPYHYGSHATESTLSMKALDTMFPYHYGSHATR